MAINVEEHELKPLFICGQPKSGTTLAVALLDSHPELLVFPEEIMMPEVMRHHSMEERVDHLLTRTDACLPALDTIETEQGNNRRDYSGIDGDGYLHDLRELLGKARNGRDILTAVFTNWRHFSSVADSRTLQYFVEKTPRNEFGRSLYLDWFPGARFLHIMRDPRDNFLSFKKLNPQRLSGRFILDWGASARIALAERDSERTLLVRYEDLVVRPRETMELVCSWLGITFSPKLLVPTKNNIRWDGNSMFLDDSGTIHTKGIGRFEKSLDRRTIEQLERYLHSEMVSLGYEPRYADQARRIPWHFRVRVRAIEYGRWLAAGAKRLLGIPSAAEKRRCSKDRLLALGEPH